MFDATRFLREEFTDVKTLLAFLHAYKAPEPSEETVRKWFQRGSVPAQWFAVLLAYLELDRSAPVSIAGYLIPQVHE